MAAAYLFLKYNCILFFWFLFPIDKDTYIN